MAAFADNSYWTIITLNKGKGERLCDLELSHEYLSSMEVATSHFTSFTQQVAIGSMCKMELKKIFKVKMFQSTLTSPGLQWCKYMDGFVTFINTIVMRSKLICSPFHILGIKYRNMLAKNSRVLVLVRIRNTNTLIKKSSIFPEVTCT